ncbi:nuclear transport factor 2 family protein [Flavobacterium orientale]|uniref:Nuclear transport factor 2 family protein n=1 Tax=Flavobacterium orientale TaxID=1756020 RepID=A0A916Y3Z5_9FLAO|nr:nuclear transport factor 2 family protein [Flavobacterium orientale]GGD30345.1 hypothetical protein GCM10011343_20640 [Flavobacterium orientale]
MKKLNILLLAVLTLIACETKKDRYTQTAPEIETYKKALKDYEMANWDELASHYADTAKVMMNVTKKNAKTVAQMIEANKQDQTLFTSYGFVPEESEYEMVVTDKGETWVNYWGLWQGRLKLNNELYEIPVHLTARFSNGKIVKEHGYWDNSAITMVLMKQADTTAVATPSVANE